ncbi:hypothetical protein [Streptomyces sp. NPDC048521]|uniref:hypothetical protein n=1 Tax=Streptomyces sp. NPDC048521 TaxID=3365566 RepID=UPI003720ADE0
MLHHHLADDPELGRVPPACQALIGPCLASRSWLTAANRVFLLDGNALTALPVF